MRRLRRRTHAVRTLATALATVIVALVAGRATAAPAASGRQAASAGPWHAVLTYDRSRGVPAYSHLRLSVRHGSTEVLDAPVRSSLQGASLLQPGAWGGRSSVSFHDLDGDGTPELLLSLFTGGAHCCFVEQVFSFASVPARKSELDFADAGATLVTAGGHLLFRTMDDTFAYVFTDFADSGEPIALWAWANGRFVDTTRSHPVLVAADAARWWRAYLAQARRKGDVRGLLAAWAADEALLGHAGTAQRTLMRLAGAGRLEVAFDGGATGTAFVRSLWRLLAKQHYLP